MRQTDCEGALDLLIQRTGIFEVLSEGPADRSSLIDRVTLSRPTVDQTLTTLETKQLVTRRDTVVSLTVAGDHLYDRYCSLLGCYSGETVETLWRRAPILDAVERTPLEKPEIVNRVDASRSTVDRAVDSLHSCDFVKRTDQGWTATDSGTEALSSYRKASDDVATILDARTFFGCLPGQAELPFSMLAAERTEIGRDRHRLFECLSEQIDAAYCCTVVPTIADSRHVRLWHARTARADGKLDVLGASELFVDIREEFPYIYQDLADTARFSAYECSPSSFGLILTAEFEQRTDDPSTGLPIDRICDTAAGSVTVIGYNGDRIGSYLHSTTDEAVQWACDIISHTVGETPRQINPTVTEPSSAVIPALPTRRLPDQLRRAGYTLIDDSYFEERVTLDPELAWTAGLGLTEVEAGYAAPRTDENGRVLSERLFDHVADGDDAVLLGPPGSGKSTVLKRVACKYRNQTDGIVCYREAANVEGHPSIESFESFLDGQCRPVLVVVEDAARTDADVVFNLIRRYSGSDRITFLLDARETEWNDPTEFPADSALDAFRHNHFEPVYVPQIDDSDCRRLLDKASELTDRQPPCSPQEILSDLRTVAAKDADTHGGAVPGLAFLLFHRLAGHTVSDTGTAMTDHVDQVLDELESLGETPLHIGVAVNAINAAGLDVDPAYPFAVALDEDGLDTVAVNDALGCLEGEILFEASDPTTAYRTIHDIWSVEFLACMVDRWGAQLASERFGTAISSVLSLATDRNGRERIGGAVGSSPALDRLLTTPGEWATSIVQHLRILGLERPKLAPLYDSFGGVSFAVPEVCGDDIRQDLRVALGRMLLSGGYLDRAERVFDSLPEERSDAGFERLLGLAEVALERSEFEVAKTHAQQGLDGIERPQTKQEARALRVLGRATMADLDRAEELYRRSLEIYESAGDQIGEARLLRCLGDVAYKRSNYHMAQDRYQRALEIYRQTSNRQGIATLLCDLAIAVEELGEYDKAKKRYRRSLSIAKEVGDRSRQAATLKNLGIVMGKSGECERAKECFHESQRLYEEIGNTSGRAGVLIDIGVLSSDHGEYETAEQYYRQGIDLFDGIEAPQKHATALVNLGRILSKQGAYDRAEKHYQQALELYTQTDERHGQAVALNNIGYMAYKRGRYDHSEQHLRRSLAIKNKIGHREGQASSLLNLGLIASVRGFYDCAQARYQQSFDIYQQIGHRDGQVDALNRLASVSRRRGRLAVAASFLDQADDALADSDDFETLVSYHQERAALTRERDNYETATRHIERALAACAETHNPHRELYVTLEQTRIAVASKEFDRANETLDTVSDLLAAVEAPIASGRELLLRGRIAARTGDFDTARGHWKKALETFEGIGALPDALRTLELLVTQAPVEEHSSEQWRSRGVALFADAPGSLQQQHEFWSNQHRSFQEQPTGGSNT